MIKELELADIEAANEMLSKFNYKITDQTFNNSFFNALVYYDNGVKGIILYSLLYDRIEIEYIIVHENYRKQGIGSKLLREIEKHDIKNITLEVKESNIEAINFYKNNGFSIASIRKNYYKNENGYLMLKELGE